MQLSTLDQVVLVNDLDQEIGVMDKIEAHRGEAKLHRAVSVFLFNSKGELLMQQRSAHKIVGARQWANTCCGNVRPGESYENCARRRLREELGIKDVELTPVHKFQYSVKCNEEFSEREIDQVFVGQYEGKIKLNKQEVAAIEFIPVSIVNSELEISPEKYAPWLQFLLENSQWNQV